MVSLTWGGNNGEERKKTTQKYWKVRMTAPRYSRDVGDRVEGEGKDDSMGDNKRCWYNQVKKLEPYIINSRKTNSVWIKILTLEQLGKNIKYHFNNNGVEKFFQDMTQNPDPAKQKIESFDCIKFLQG